MLRRVLAAFGVVCALAGFVLIPVSIATGMNFLIPVGLIVAAFLILLLVKRMEVPEEEPSVSEQGSQYTSVNEGDTTESSEAEQGR